MCALTCTRRRHSPKKGSTSNVNHEYKKGTAIHHQSDLFSLSFFFPPSSSVSDFTLIAVAHPRRNFTSTSTLLPSPLASIPLLPLSVITLSPLHNKMGTSDELTIPTISTVGPLGRRKRTTRPIPRALSLVDTSTPALSIQESSGDTSMDLGGAVIFCVNPPASPQSSDTYSEDQDAFHQAWCTSYDNPAPAVSSSPRDSFTQRGLAQFSPSRCPEAPKNTDIGLTADQANSTKKPQGSRRSSLAENSRKSELYKTELCVSLTSGLPCK